MMVMSMRPVNHYSTKVHNSPRNCQSKIFLINDNSLEPRYSGASIHTFQRMELGALPAFSYCCKNFPNSTPN